MLLSEIRHPEPQSLDFGRILDNSINPEATKPMQVVKPWSSTMALTAQIATFWHPYKTTIRIRGFSFAGPLSSSRQVTPQSRSVNLFLLLTPPCIHTRLQHSIHFSSLTLTSSPAVINVLFSLCSNWSIPIGWKVQANIYYRTHFIVDGPMLHEVVCITLPYIPYGAL